MTARKKFLAGLVLVTVLGGVIWWAIATRVPDPIYEGKHLSQWLGFYSKGALFEAEQRKADEAVRQAGTNAIPLLLRLMRAHDSPLTRKLKLWANRLQLVKSPFELAYRRNEEAAIGFSVLGSEAKSAVPDLLRIYDARVSDASKDASKDAEVVALNKIAAFCALKALWKIADPETAARVGTNRLNPSRFDTEMIDSPIIR